MNIKKQKITVVDVDPFKTYENCPLCGESNFCEETSGPLTGWTTCLDCGAWFSPEIKFE